MTRRLALLAAAAALPLTACSTSGQSSEPGGVVTAMYPLQYVAERIAGDRVPTTSLTTPGQEPHDLELGVEQTARLAEAAVVVHVSGLQPAVDEAIEQSGPDRVVDAAEVVDLRPADDHAHEEEGHGEVHEGAHDPHFWLDPTRMADLATAVEAALADSHPEHAEEFAANLETLRDDLAALDEEYRTGLGTCRTRTVVVSHDAFGYLARYGLELAPIAGLSPGAEPSPAHLAELERLIRSEGVTTVFSETLASPEMAETLAAEVGIETAVLDPLEGLGDETADEDYLSLMRANLEALRAANGCR